MSRGFDRAVLILRKRFAGRGRGLEPVMSVLLRGAMLRWSNLAGPDHTAVREALTCQEQPSSWLWPSMGTNVSDAKNSVWFARRHSEGPRQTR